MAQTLSEMSEQILGKEKAAVQGMLGEPAKVGYWKNRARPEDDSELAAYNESTLDQIWIYLNGRVHFNVAGKAVKVDDKVQLDMPPPENFV